MKPGAIEVETSQQGILQVHPTRLCNLACSHCYTDSSPTTRTSLDPNLLCGALEDAAALGFKVVSLSGGEPLLYEGLGELLQTAKASGQRTNLVSNGILIQNSRYRKLAGSFDAVALSLDGLADRHNRVRNSSRSYDQVRLAAAVLRQDGQRFGLIHTLTSESLDEVEDIASIAIDWGAGFLQLHPFETSGRGATVTGMSELSAHEMLIAWLTVRALRLRFPGLQLQLDLIHREVVRMTPEAIGVSSTCSPPRELVVDELGAIVPLCHGVPKRWQVTSLNDLDLRTAWPEFLRLTWPALRHALDEAAHEVGEGAHGDVVAWHSIARNAASNAAPMQKPIRFVGRHRSGETYKAATRL